jgi:hypothetical protein
MISIFGDENFIRRGDCDAPHPINVKFSISNVKWKITIEPVS